MNPTIWLVILIISLAVECAQMNLGGICLAPGAAVAAIMSFCGLPFWMDLIAFILVSAAFIILARPILAIYMNRHKKQARLNRLIGCDAIVICEIDNAHGVGVVNIGGREYRARSNRPNAIIREGSKVKVVEMRGDTAMVDDLKRTSTGRIDLPGVGDDSFWDDRFIDDYDD